MEENNIIITDLNNGFVQLKAKEGYNLYSKLLFCVVSEAVIKSEQISQFEAKSIGE